jgi:hypothetical protein
VICRALCGGAYGDWCHYHAFQLTITLHDGCLGVSDMSEAECREVLDGVFTKGLHAVMQQFVDRTRSDVLSSTNFAEPVHVRPL